MKNGSQLYVGYDNATTGVQMWRTKSSVSNPTSESDFEQIGASDFGDRSNNLELYSSVSLEQSGSFYVNAGRTGSTPVQPVRVYRQVNTGPLAFLGQETVSKLLAYINRGNNKGYSLALLGIIIAILVLFKTRKSLHEKKE